MSIQFQDAPFNQRVTLLNDAKFRLIGDMLEGNQPGRLPFMQVSLNKNYPQIRVVLNNGKKGDEGSFVLNLDMQTFMGILVALEDATRAKQEMCHLFDVKRQAFDPATRKPKEPYSYAVIAVGKNVDGVEFIGIQRGNPGGKNFVRVNFFFTAPEFHPILDRTTMQPATRQTVSNLMARGFVKLYTQLLPLINAHTWVYAETAEAKREAKRAQQGQQGGYGNQQQQQGYQPSYQPQAQPAVAPAAPAVAPQDNSFEDDIPW